MIPTDDRRDDEDRDPDIDAVMHGDRRAVAAHHHELAMRQVDDAHHAEHDGKSEADQGERGDRIDEIDRNDDR